MNTTHAVMNLNTGDIVFRGTRIECESFGYDPEIESLAPMESVKEFREGMETRYAGFVEKL